MVQHGHTHIVFLHHHQGVSRGIGGRIRGIFTGFGQKKERENFDNFLDDGDLSQSMSKVVWLRKYF